MGCYSESAARRYFCRDVGRPICGWRRSVGSKWHEGSRCRAWPSPVQLSFAGNPPYTHLVSTELAVTLICSLLLTRLDYCNSVLYGAPVSSIQVLQRVQNNATMVILRALRRDSCPAITVWAALVAHSTQNRVQGGCVDSSRVAAAPQHRHTSVVTSRLASVNGHFARLQSDYWTSRSPGQTSRDEPFAVLRQLSGTHCLRH